MTGGISRPTVDLNEDIGLGEESSPIRHDAGASFFVYGIGKTCPLTGVVFHQNRHPGLGQDRDDCGHQGNPPLTRIGFNRHSDDHPDLWFTNLFSLQSK